MLRRLGVQMSKSRKEQINKVWTNLFVKLSQAQAKSFDKSSRKFKSYKLKHLFYVVIYSCERGQVVRYINKA